MARVPNVEDHRALPWPHVLRSTCAAPLRVTTAAVPCPSLDFVQEGGRYQWVTYWSYQHTYIPNIRLFRTPLQHTYIPTQSFTNTIDSYMYRCTAVVCKVVSEG